MAGALRSVFGVCANEWSPSDGRVISLDHGCGAHSETDVEQPEPSPLGEPIVDEFAVDLEPALTATPTEGGDTPIESGPSMESGTARRATAERTELSGIRPIPAALPGVRCVATPASHVEPAIAPSSDPGDACPGPPVARARVQRGTTSVTTSASDPATMPPSMIASASAREGRSSSGSRSRAAPVVGSRRSRGKPRVSRRIARAPASSPLGFAAMSTETPTPSSHVRARPLLQDHRARLDRGAGGARRRRHVLHDGVHRRPQPDHPLGGHGRLRADDRRRRRPRAEQAPRRGGHRGVAGLMSILMGLVANFPIALAAGLGINGLIAGMVFTHAAEKITFADLMGLVVLEGIIILVLVLTGFRTAVFRAIPARSRSPSRSASACSSRSSGSSTPALPGPDHPRLRPQRARHRRQPQRVADARLRLRRLPHLPLLIRKVKGAILIAILACDRARDHRRGDRRHRSADLRRQACCQPRPAGCSTCRALPDSITNTPDFGILGQFNLLGSFEKLGLVTTILLVFIADARRLLRHDGHHRRPSAPRRSCSTRTATRPTPSASSSSTRSPRPPVAPAASRRNTCYIESAAGVGEGARTGLASIVTGLLFLLTTFLAPLVANHPVRGGRAGPGHRRLPHDACRCRTSTGTTSRSRIPAFLTIILMPFTYTDHRRHRRGVHLVGAHQGRARQCPPDAPDDVDRRRPSSSCTSSCRRSPSWSSPDREPLPGCRMPLSPLPHGRRRRVCAGRVRRRRVGAGNS